MIVAILRPDCLRDAPIACPRARFAHGDYVLRLSPIHVRARATFALFGPAPDKAQGHYCPVSSAVSEGRQFPPVRGGDDGGPPRFDGTLCRGAVGVKDLLSAFEVDDDRSHIGGWGDGSFDGPARCSGTHPLK